MAAEKDPLGCTSGAGCLLFLVIAIGGAHNPNIIVPLLVTVLILIAISQQ